MVRWAAKEAARAAQCSRMAEEQRKWHPWGQECPRIPRNTFKLAAPSCPGSWSRNDSFRLYKHSRFFGCWKHTSVAWSSGAQGMAVLQSQTAHRDQIWSPQSHLGLQFFGGPVEVPPPPYSLLPVHATPSQGDASVSCLWSPQALFSPHLHLGCCGGMGSEQSSRPDCVRGPPLGEGRCQVLWAASVRHHCL